MIERVFGLFKRRRKLLKVKPQLVMGGVTMLFENTVVDTVRHQVLAQPCKRVGDSRIGSVADVYFDDGRLVFDVAYRENGVAELIRKVRVYDLAFHDTH